MELAVIGNSSDAGNVPLLPYDIYFVSGAAAFKELIDTVVGPIELPVRDSIRLFSAQTPFTQWIRVPLMIIERGAW